MQHDFDLSESLQVSQVIPDIENAIKAAASLNSGATAPTVTFAGMWWYDTANSLVRQRNAADDGWITRFKLGVADALDSIQPAVNLFLSDEDVFTGKHKFFFTMPVARTLVGVKARVITAGTGGNSAFDILKNGSSVLSTKITIEDGETKSSTAASQPVISSSSFAEDDLVEFEVLTLSSTAPKGLEIKPKWE